MEQYKHKDIAVTKDMQEHFDASVTAANGVTDSTQARISVLEETVERQGRLIRDLQSMIQYMQFSKK